MKIDLLHVCIKYTMGLVADVAELADALDSKSGIRKGVWVRPPPSAPSLPAEMAAANATGRPAKAARNNEVLEPAKTAEEAWHECRISSHPATVCSYQEGAQRFA